MSRLVNADELIALFNRRSTINVVGDGLCKVIITRIEALPTVEAVPVRNVKHGRWIDRNGSIVAPFWERYECSECGARSDNSKYCPNCGARMDGND